MKNVTITGHTRGIGLSLANRFAKEGYNIIGYSRSTGHDISTEQAVNEIIENLKDGIFINNTFDLYGQLALLEGAIKKWQGTDNLIINIGSKLVHAWPPGQHPDWMTAYLKSKRRQDEIIRSRFKVSSPTIINIVVGPVETSLSESMPGPKLQTEDVSDLIFYLQSIKDTVAVNEIVMCVPHTNWIPIFGLDNLDD